MGARSEIPRDNDLGFVLSRLGTTTRLRLAEAVAPLDLTLRQYVVLKAINSEEGLSQAQLGDRLRIDASSIVQVLDDCQRDGLSERRQSPDDRRRYAIYLTQQGKRQLVLAATNIKVVQDELFKALNDKQTAQLLQLLSILAASGPLSGTVAGPNAVLAGSAQ